MLRLVSLCLLLGAANAKPPEFYPTKVPSVKSKAPSCGTCLQMTNQTLSTLLNVTLNSGLVGGCGKLCGHVNQTAARDACELTCLYVGFEKFVKPLIVDPIEDLDTIYFCEMLHQCQAGADDAHVDLLGVKFDPPTIAGKDIQMGAEGVDLEGMLTIDVTKEMGVGEWCVGVHGPVTGQPSTLPCGTISASFALPDGLKVGKHTLGAKLHILDTTDTTWNGGSYEFLFHVCQEKCGSKHPHSIDFGRKSGNFTITGTTSSQVVV